jgi:SAM-dependent methyltransferase
MIELLDVDILRAEPKLAAGFYRKAARLHIQLGWHYILDLIWIARRLGPAEGLNVLDAGAGLGVLQWWLADRGATVVSVDRQDRSDLPGRMRLAHRVRGQRSGDLSSAWAAVRHRLAQADAPLPRRLALSLRATAVALASRVARKGRGEVLFIRQDLTRPLDLPDDAVDAVVSVSALEHNAPDELPAVVEELMRVLRPGGILLATLAAARECDWYHEPSRGWCYTEATLRRVFDLPAQAESNFARFDELFDRLRGSETLRRRLAPFHSLSGECGMPWGVWNPVYLPVGVVKVKSSATGLRVQSPPAP